MSADAFAAAMPLNLRLEEFIQGDEADLWWIPVVTNDEQAEATSDLQRSIARYERAFGLENTCQQLKLIIETGQALARKNAAMDRVIAARADINAEAAEARAQGDEEAARLIEGRPTPDYPQKADDERELGYDV